MDNKGLRFLLSLVIALGIWLLVVSVVNPESEAEIRDIPVILNGESVLADRNLIIVSDKNFTVNLKLFGNSRNYFIFKFLRNKRQSLKTPPF